MHSESVPFSIGSGNEANYLCFLIEVKPGQSWTGRLESDACIAKLLSGEAALQVLDTSETHPRHFETLRDTSETLRDSSETLPSC